MEAHQNGREPKWKTTKMEANQHGRRPKWKTKNINNLNKNYTQTFAKFNCISIFLLFMLILTYL